MAHPQLIPVINRLGLSLGVGESSIETVCRHAGIDLSFFLSVVNTFVDKDYFPVNARGTFSLEKTVDYLYKTSLFYLHVQLPNIERHFNSLLERSGKENNLELLRGFFDDMKAQLTDCLEYDCRVFFPALKRNELPSDAGKAAEAYAEVEEKLHDLLCFFVAHLRGDYDQNLCMAVVSAVFSLEKDYCQNNRIRSRILLPAIEEMKNLQEL